MTPLKLGKRGYFGTYTNSKDKNATIDKINKIIDLYNDKINSFITYEEQNKFTEDVDYNIENLSLLV